MTVENSEKPEKQENRVARRRHISIFWPLLLITIGVLLFLNNIGMIQGSGWDLILRLWPVILIVGGLDGLFRREGVVAAVVFLGLGVIFLLSNLGYLALSSWEILLRYWPVFLVAIGIDIIIGRRKIWGLLLGALIGLLLVGGVAFLIVGATGAVNVQSQPVNFALNDVSQSTGSITMAVGRLDLASGAAAGNVMDGNLRMGALGAVEQSGSGSSFSLDATASSYVAVGVNDSPHWSLRLNPAVQYNLNVNMAVGEAYLNLTGLNVNEINGEMAVGRMEVRLPNAAVSGEIQGAVGETVVYVPQGAVVHIHLNTGLTGVSLPPGYARNDNEVSSPNQQTAGPVINLTVGQALGAVSIRYLP
jgi:hypothetical protein